MVEGRNLVSYAEIRGYGMSLQQVAKALNISKESILRGIDRGGEEFQERGWKLTDLGDGIIGTTCPGPSPDTIFIVGCHREECMSAELMLETTDPSLLVIEERTHKDIVVGVPHHAPAGKSTLPCPEHKDADENAGFLGRYLAEKLGCCSIIACNYTVDANKFLRSDYSMQIAAWNPKVLVEIHGHGGTKAKYDIEISSGSSDNDKFSKVLAEKLQTAFNSDADLKSLKVSGEYANLYFQATKAVTISDGGWLAYHIELPPKLRNPPGAIGGKPPEMGYRFCDILANVLQEIHRNKTSQQVA